MSMFVTGRYWKGRDGAMEAGLTLRSPLLCHPIFISQREETAVLAALIKQTSESIKHYTRHKAAVRAGMHSDMCSGMHAANIQAVRQAEYFFSFSIWINEQKLGFVRAWMCLLLQLSIGPVYEYSLLLSPNKFTTVELVV